MQETKTGTLAIRMPESVKKQFLELYDKSSTGSKSEYFKSLLDKDKEKTLEPIPVDTKETPPPPQEEPVIELKEEVIEEKVEPEKEEDFEEITFKLTPVQAYAVRETILNDGFAQEVNKIVKKVDEAIDTSVFGNSLYSGMYKGIFTPMDIDIDNMESINKNICTALINHFISSIVFGPSDLYTPVSQNDLKVFIQEQDADESEEE